MIGPTNARGSGGGLNLKVVGGTTQPTNPKENTIWINTTTAITGYVLSPTRPENGTDGLVWLKTADTGVEINVGRKNAVLLHLASCNIYAGNKWDYIEAHIYRGNIWVQFAFKLVPGEYTAVEYIQGTGTQYIKSGLTGFTHLYGFEVDYIMQSSLANDTSADTGTFFGARKNDYNLYTMGTYGGGSLKLGYSVSVSLKDTLKRLVRQQIKKHLNTVTLPDGTSKAVVPTASNMANLGDLEMFVFVQNNAGHVSSQRCKYQLFSLKFYDANDELISDLVPCYRNSDNVAGLWDRIREVFLTNAGTGTFAVGEAIT